MGFFSKPKTSAAKAKVLQITDFLTEKTVLFFPTAPSKRQIFGSLIGALDLPDPGEAMKSILAREEAGSTVITSGVALPHARIPGISGIKAALGICPEGYESRTDGTRINVILLFLGPAENMREHLAFLAAVSAVFQKQGLVDKLTKLASPKGVLVTLRDIEKKL